MPLSPSIAHAPQHAVAARADVFPEGPHRAAFTVDHMQGAEKERIEEIVLARRGHVRPNESMTLVESGDHIVVHQRFASLVSVQELIAAFRKQGIAPALEILWNDEVAAQPLATA